MLWFYRQQNHAHYITFHIWSTKVVFLDELPCTVCIVIHRPPPCAVTIHKTCTDQKCNGCHGSAEINANVLAKYIKHNMENFEHSQQWKKHFGITDVHLWTVVHVLIIEELTCLSGLTLGVIGCHWRGSSDLSQWTCGTLLHSRVQLCNWGCSG